MSNTWNCHGLYPKSEGLVSSTQVSSIQHQIKQWWKPDEKFYFPTLGERLGIRAEALEICSQSYRRCYPLRHPEAWVRENNAICFHQRKTKKIAWDLYIIKDIARHLLDLCSKAILLISSLEEEYLWPFRPFPLALKEIGFPTKSIYKKRTIHSNKTTG